MLLLGMVESLFEYIPVEKQTWLEHISHCPQEKVVFSITAGQFWIEAKSVLSILCWLATLEIISILPAEICSFTTCQFMHFHMACVSSLPVPWNPPAQELLYIDKPLKVQPELGYVASGILEKQLEGRIISSLPKAGTTTLMNVLIHCVSQTNSNFTCTIFYNVAWLFGIGFMWVILCLCRGYGFVKFTDELEQKRALTECQGAVGLGSKPVRLSVAIPKAWVEEQLDIYMKNRIWF